jgi:biotin transport system substrate-specific component
MDKRNNAVRILKTREITYIGLFVAVMAVCSWISVPMTIPFTMQTFAVFLTAALLGTRLGTITVAAYMLLGAVGLPVFSGFKGGLGVLMGPTGGYIIGFIFTALITGTMIERFGRGRIMMAASMLVGLAVCYAFGTVWFLKVYANTKGAVSVATALGWCVIPYILPDCVKILLAVTVAERLGKSMKM